MPVINIPNRKYYAVFDLVNATKEPKAVALFEQHKHAKEWGSVYFKRGDYLIKEVYAQVNVIA